ncbi:MAG: glycosyltransferase family 4 protein [Polyangiaceae bacterium]
MKRPAHGALHACFFSHASDLGGGAERSLVELAEHLTEHFGVSCSFIVPERTGALVTRLRDAGISTHPVRMDWWCTTGEESLDARNERLRASAAALKKAFRQDLPALRADVFFTNTVTIPWGAAAANLANRPHIWCIREWNDTFTFGEPLALTTSFLRTASSKVLTNSEAVKRAWFGRRGRGVGVLYPSPRVPPWVEAAQGHFSIPGALRVMVLGRIAKQKGQIEAIRAVAELVRAGHNVELALVGGISQAYLDDLLRTIEASKLGDRLGIFEATPSPLASLASADVVVVPARNEPFGRVPVEAMLLGKPVIAARSGGLTEIVRPGEGLLYRPGDAAGLARQIARLARQPTLAARVAKVGCASAKRRFNLERSARLLYRCLQSVRDQGAPNSPQLRAFMKTMRLLDA